MIWVFGITDPVTEILPLTCNFSDGVVVPIPTLPLVEPNITSPVVVSIALCVVPLNDVNVLTYKV